MHFVEEEDGVKGVLDFFHSKSHQFELQALDALHEVSHEVDEPEDFPSSPDDFPSSPDESPFRAFQTYQAREPLVIGLEDVEEDTDA